ncbi:MAG: hypothetical protein ACLFNN_01880 [Candidatus Paceibacterota bacterium]
MLQLTTKRKLKKWVWSRLSLVTLLLLVFLMFIPVWNMYNKYSESKGDHLAAKARMDELLSKKEKFESEIDYLESSLGKEAEVRSFNAGKEGEQMAVIIEDERLEENDDLEDNKKEGFWKKVKGWFTSLF